MNNEFFGLQASGKNWRRNSFREMQMQLRKMHLIETWRGWVFWVNEPYLDFKQLNLNG